MESAFLQTESLISRTLLVIINTAYLDLQQNTYNSPVFIDKLQKWQTQCGIQFFQHFDTIDAGNGVSIRTKDYLNGSLLNEEYAIKNRLFFGPTDAIKSKNDDQEITAEVKKIIGWLKFKWLYAKYFVLLKSEEPLLLEKYKNVLKDWVLAGIEDRPHHIAFASSLVAKEDEAAGLIQLLGVDRKTFLTQESLEIFIQGVQRVYDSKLQVSLNEETKTFKHLHSVFTYFGVAILTVGIIGMVGNGLNIIVLSSVKMRKIPFNVMLIGLAVCDFFILVHQNLFAGVKNVNEDFGRIFVSGSFLYYVGFLTEPASMASTYLTVAISGERYVAVCHPLHVKSIVTVKKSVLMSILIPTVCVICYIPMKLRYECALTLELPNLSHTDCGHETSLGENKFYKLFVGTYALVLKYILPVTLLTIFNGLICFKIYKRNAVRAEMGVKTGDSKNTSLFKILITIVVIFLICYSFEAYRSGLAILSSPTPNNLVDDVESLVAKLNQINDKNTHELIGLASALLIQCNSAVNFILYCVFGKDFRSMVSKMVWGPCKNWCYRNRQLVSPITTDTPLTG